MNSIALLILIIGIIFIILGYNNSTNKCPPKEIQYRFLPRTFYDEQMEPVNISNVFGNLFDKEDSWLNRFSGSEKDEINWKNYFNN